MAGQRRTSTIDVDASGFMEDVERAIADMRSRGRSGVERLAIDVQNRARQLCPVDTGRLRASIAHQPGTDAQGFYVDVGTDVEYAAYVEYGTSTHPAQPFMRPAFAEASGADWPGILEKGG